MANVTMESLKALYEAKKEEQPNLRIRDAAFQLGVSELELLELELGFNVVRLKKHFTSILKEVHKVGYVMALTRNEYAVHERKGVYHNISFMKDSQMGVAVNPDIDLRFLMWDWKHAYAVRMEKGNKTLYSLQFFNSYGEAIHKIYLTGKSNPAAYQELIEQYKAKNQKTLAVLKSRTEKTMVKEKNDESIAVSGFKRDWLALRDTHDFFPLLKKYEVSRTQALRLAPEGYAYQVAKDAIAEVFEQAVLGEVPIMVFVNSPGCIQIHTGEVKNLIPMKNWFNVMDPEFNLHLNMDGVDSCWVVKKPTVDGIVTSLELYDEAGDLIVYCFGARKPGLPELGAWRNIIGELAAASK